MNLEFPQQLFEKYSNISSHDIPISGSRVVPRRRMGRRTDMTKLIAPFFAIFRTRLKTRIMFLETYTVNNAVLSYLCQ